MTEVQRIIENVEDSVEEESDSTSAEDDESQKNRVEVEFCLACFEYQFYNYFWAGVAASVSFYFFYGYSMDSIKQENAMLCAISSGFFLLLLMSPIKGNLCRRCPWREIFFIFLSGVFEYYSLLCFVNYMMGSTKHEDTMKNGVLLACLFVAGVVCLASGFVLGDGKYMFYGLWHSANEYTPEYAFIPNCEPLKLQEFLLKVPRLLYTAFLRLLGQANQTSEGKSEHEGGRIEEIP